MLCTPHVNSVPEKPPLLGWAQPAALGAGMGVGCFTSLPSSLPLGCLGLLTSLNNQHFLGCSPCSSTLLCAQSSSTLKPPSFRVLSL